MTNGTVLVKTTLLSSNELVMPIAIGMMGKYGLHGYHYRMHNDYRALLEK